MLSRVAVSIEPVGWDHPEGRALRRAQEEELRARYGGEEEPGAALSAADTAVFLLARDKDTGAAVGCGGLRRLDEETFELKRMFVAAEQRGRRIGEHLLRALESEAASRGARRVRLEAGTRQPEALRLYERCGYHPIERFGAYAESELSRCFERVLSRPENALGPGAPAH